VLALVWGWKRIQRVQQEQRRRTAPSSNAPSTTSTSSPIPATPNVPAVRPAPVSVSKPSSRKKVIVSTNNILLNRDAFVDGVLPFLTALTQSATVFLISQCDGIDTEKRIVEIIRRSGLIEAGLAEHRILFCTTAKGKSAMIRHLEPSLIIEDDPGVAVELQPFIEEIVFISTDSAAASRVMVAAHGGSNSASTLRKRNISVKSSLLEFFGAKSIVPAPAKLLSSTDSSALSSLSEMKIPSLSSDVLSTSSLPTHSLSDGIDLDSGLMYG